jgi:hypothetical protein
LSKLDISIVLDLSTCTLISGVKWMSRYSKTLTINSTIIQNIRKLGKKFQVCEVFNFSLRNSDSVCYSMYIISNLDNASLPFHNLSLIYEQQTKQMFSDLKTIQCCTSLMW